MTAGALRIRREALILTLELPEQVTEILELLKAHTYTPYLVGDCVNSLILGERTMDFDIACNATVDRIIAIFENKYKIVEDELYKGELIIITGGMGISVAPFRSRFDRNGKPVYCNTIDEDLRRRCFSVNAIAYSPDIGLYDPFGGAECLERDIAILRAIEERRFCEAQQLPAGKKAKKAPEKAVIPVIRENPRCILEAMLKYSRGEAEISPTTLENMCENPELLDSLSNTEVMASFRDIIMGKRITETLMLFSGVVFYLFPMLREQENYDQRSRHQEYTLFEHTARAVGYAVPDITLRLALLFHGAGKVDCAADRESYISYDGHGERGAMLLRGALSDYGVEAAITGKAEFLILHHDDRINPENKGDFVKRYGTENTRLLLLLQSANVRAKSSEAVNERVSASLRQLAEDTAAKPAERAKKNNTVTLAGLKSISKMLEYKRG